MTRIALEYVPFCLKHSKGPRGLRRIPTECPHLDIRTGHRHGRNDLKRNRTDAGGWWWMLTEDDGVPRAQKNDISRSRICLFQCGIPARTLDFENSPPSISQKYGQVVDKGARSDPERKIAEPYGVRRVGAGGGGVSRCESGLFSSEISTWPSWVSRTPRRYRHPGRRSGGQHRRDPERKLAEDGGSCRKREGAEERCIIRLFPP